jgi:N-acetylmuramoyl-L-alanine amidase
VSNLVAVTATLYVAPVCAALAQTADTALWSAPPVQLGCARSRFGVVLDVGHTAESRGAISARGVPEFLFNLHLGQQMEKALLDAGFARTVLLVTEGAAKPSLYARVARANALQADLLLSIHHDSVPEPFLRDWDFVGGARRFSDDFKGHSIFISNEHRDTATSLKFARLLGHQLKARNLHYTPHYTQAAMGRYQRRLVDAETGVYRYDRLLVLRTTHMPAVLLEAGSIINREEELIAASAERHAVLAAAVTAAVEEFCATRTVPPTVMSAQRRVKKKLGAKKLPKQDEPQVVSAPDLSATY